MSLLFNLKFFTAEDIKRVLPMHEAIKIAKEAFIQLSSGQAVVPPRTHLEIPEHNTTTLIMPSYLPKSKQIGLKVISLCGENPHRGLPLASSLMLVLDVSTGVPLAVMDGSYLTALRTGAASGAASDVLARKDAQIAAIFGAGIQGRTQLEAIAAVRPIKKAYIFELDAERAKKYVNEMREKLLFDIEIAESSQVLRQADVICTVTTSGSPVFADRDLKPGVHINAVGSYKPHVREIPGETVVRAKIVVDHRDSSLSEAGDLIIPMQQGFIDNKNIQAEIGEILAGLKPGRSSESEITLFKSVGNAVQDLTAASQVLSNAEKRKDAYHTIKR